MVWKAASQATGEFWSPLGTIVFHAPSTFNPTLDVAALQRIRDEDPEAARSELDAEFRAGLSLLLDADATDAVVNRGVREIPPVPGTIYHSGNDLSGGRNDPAAQSITHAENGVIVEDLSRAPRRR